MLRVLESFEAVGRVSARAVRWGEGSVTGLIHRYVEPFDRDGVIRTMMGSRRWPRPGYLVALMRKCVELCDRSSSVADRLAHM